MTLWSGARSSGPQYSHTHRYPAFSTIKSGRWFFSAVLIMLSGVAGACELASRTSSLRSFVMAATPRATKGSQVFTDLGIGSAILFVVVCKRWFASMAGAYHSPPPSSPGSPATNRTRTELCLRSFVSLPVRGSPFLLAF